MRNTREQRCRIDYSCQPNPPPTRYLHRLGPRAPRPFYPPTAEGALVPAFTRKARPILGTIAWTRVSTQRKKDCCIKLTIGSSPWHQRLVFEIHLLSRSYPSAPVCVLTHKKENGNVSTQKNSDSHPTPFFWRFRPSAILRREKRYLVELEAIVVALALHGGDHKAHKVSGKVCRLFFGHAEA